jgi:hypothetical protein
MADSIRYQVPVSTSNARKVSRPARNQVGYQIRNPDELNTDLLFIESHVMVVHRANLELLTQQ